MTGAIIAIVIVLLVVAGITTIVVGYYRLQRHRADAVALAGYRALAEQVTHAQTTLNDQLTAIETRLGAVEKLLRDVS
jgi:fatty-acid desaturase